MADSIYRYHRELDYRSMYPDEIAELMRTATPQDLALRAVTRLILIQQHYIEQSQATADEVIDTTDPYDELEGTTIAQASRDLRIQHLTLSFLFGERDQIETGDNEELINRYREFELARIDAALTQDGSSAQLPE